jgi:hypothetical protein
MAILLKVQWVDKTRPAEPGRRIHSIGGVSNQLQWRHSFSQVVESIERDAYVYYVEENARALTLDVRRTTDGNKYLAVETANEQLLLDLPEFPAVTNPAAQVT